MITCSVCGHLNDPSRATCEECGSDLSDSEDWGVDFDEADEGWLFDEGGNQMPTGPDCGSVVMEGDPYCTHCGAHLSWNNGEPQQNRQKPQTN